MERPSVFSKEGFDNLIEAYGFASEHETPRTTSISLPYDEHVEYMAAALAYHVLMSQLRDIWDGDRTRLEYPLQDTLNEFSYENVKGMLDDFVQYANAKTPTATADTTEDTKDELMKVLQDISNGQDRLIEQLEETIALVKQENVKQEKERSYGD